MASTREISLLLRLDVAGTSVLSGVSALATKELLKDMPPSIRPLNIPNPHRPTSPPDIRKKSAAVRHSCFLGT